MVDQAKNRKKFDLITYCTQAHSHIYKPNIE